METLVGSGITPRGGRRVYTKRGIPFIRSQNVYRDGICARALRHLRATIWYHSGIDLKTLQERIGHRNINHTFRYIHLPDGYFPETTQKYYTRVTSTINEGEKLVQQGFELVGSDQSGCLWRKPKTFEDFIRERERELNVKSEF